jgi:CDP-paratose 2-epimerase
MRNRFLITGGAGFIGSNYAARLLARGEEVVLYDNLSRAGATRNLEWLKEKHGSDSFELVVGDVRNAEKLVQISTDVDVIVHLAAQVAVTTSVIDPREDFDINAIGTFNVMEAARLSGRKPIVIYASTNKVYGGMEDVKVLEGETNYYYQDYPLGIPESMPLDFHSPYGCSKGSGDQYVRDYARIYGIPSFVMRQSCIYGTRQFGIEDQGWVAWFVIASIMGKEITIYGDGKQVRDVLFVDDLLDAYDAALDHVDDMAGEVYNIGGGPGLTMSIWKEFKPHLERLSGGKINVKWGDWRPGDQRIFVSDIRKADRELGWKPKTQIEDGLQQLYQWAETNRYLFDKV